MMRFDQITLASDANEHFSEYPAVRPRSLNAK